MEEACEGGLDAGVISGPSQSVFWCDSKSFALDPNGTDDD